jgi:hypothetical protein
MGGMMRFIPKIERGVSPFDIYNLGRMFGGGGGGGGATPLVIPATPSAAPLPPAMDSATVAALADAQRKKFQSGGGRSTTMLTGGLGIPNDSKGATAQLGGVGQI